MRLTHRVTVSAFAFVAAMTGVALTGCAADTGPTTVLSTVQTSVGEIVADADGHAVYLYSEDTRGAGESTCEGSCLAAWPAVTTTSTDPQGEGVTGTIGEIPAAGGGYQVTLDGWPLYYFDGDTAPKMIKGQGIGDVWWLMSPDGQRITDIGR
jgi:predicted lipoprotein with Yx(FWY)xxD motif